MIRKEEIILKLLHIYSHFLSWWESVIGIFWQIILNHSICSPVKASGTVRPIILREQNATIYFEIENQNGHHRLFRSVFIELPNGSIKVGVDEGGLNGLKMTATAAKLIRQIFGGSTLKAREESQNLGRRRHKVRREITFNWIQNFAEIKILKHLGHWKQSYLNSVSITENVLSKIKANH